MPKMFISYRRTDSMAYTGRIYDRLVTAFGVKNVFKDVDDIPPGMDFRDVLDKALNASDIVLVIIGPQWLLTTDDYGKRRLLDPQDFVRLEVEAALKRDDVLVIPVLVNNAPMPSAESLPPTLKDLAYRNSIVVRNDPDFNRDINQLIDVIQKRKKPSRTPLMFGLVALVAIIAVLALVVLPSLNQPTATPTPTQVAQVVETEEATEAPTATDVPPTAEASPTVEATPEPSATPEATKISAADLTPTVLYPDGRPLQFLYNQSSFYVYNASNRTLPFEALTLEGLDAEGQPNTFRFEGSRWSRRSESIFETACGAIEPPQFADQLRPSTCTAYNSIINQTEANELFWRAENSAAFRVLWNGEEVGRCDLNAEICEVRVP